MAVREKRCRISVPWRRPMAEKRVNVDKNNSATRAEMTNGRSTFLAFGIRGVRIAKINFRVSSSINGLVDEVKDGLCNGAGKNTDAPRGKTILLSGIARMF